MGALLSAPYENYASQLKDAINNNPSLYMSFGGAGSRKQNNDNVNDSKDGQHPLFYSEFQAQTNLSVRRPFPIFGGGISSDSQSIDMAQGELTDNDYRRILLRGGGLPSDSQNIDVAQSEITNNDYRRIRIRGGGLPSDSQSNCIGQSEDTSNDHRRIRIRGGGLPSDSQSNCIGQSEITNNDHRRIRIRGGGLPSDSETIFRAQSEDTSNDHRRIRIRGGGLPSDSENRFRFQMCRTVNDSEKDKLTVGNKASCKRKQKRKQSKAKTTKTQQNTVNEEQDTSDELNIRLPSFMKSGNLSEDEYNICLQTIYNPSFACKSEFQSQTTCTDSEFSGFSSTSLGEKTEDYCSFKISKKPFLRLKCSNCNKMLTRETTPYSPEHLNIHVLAYKHVGFINRTENESADSLWCYICTEIRITELGFVHYKDHALVVCKNCLKTNIKKCYLESYTPFYVPYTKDRDSMSDYYYNYDYLIENDSTFANYVERMNMIIQSDIDSKTKNSEKINKVQVSITFSNNYIYTINIDSRLSHFAKQLILHSTVLFIKDDMKVICTVNSVNKTTITLTGDCPFKVKIVDTKNNTILFEPFLLDYICTIQSTIISDRQKEAIKHMTDSSLYSCLVDPSKISDTVNKIENISFDDIQLNSSGIEQLVSNICTDPRDHIKAVQKYNTHLSGIINMLNHTVSMYDSGTVIEPLLFLLRALGKQFTESRVLVCCADNNTCDLLTIALNAYGFETLRQMAYSRKNVTSKYGDFSQFCSGRQAIDYYNKNFTNVYEETIILIKTNVYKYLPTKLLLSSSDIINSFFTIFESNRSATSINDFVSNNYYILPAILKSLPLDIDQNCLDELISLSKSSDTNQKSKISNVLYTLLNILFHQLDYELSKKKENELDFIENYLLSTNKIVLSTLISAGSSVFEGCTFDKVIIINAHLCREVDCLIPIQYNCDHLFIFDNKRKREALNEKQGNVPSEYIIGNRLLEYIEYSNSVKK